MDDLLTLSEPEYTLASRGGRVMAALIDAIILFVAGYIISDVSGQSKSFNGNTGDGYTIGFSLTGFPAVVLIFTWFLLLPVMEGFTGQTIGKMLLKIKVVQQDFLPATLKHTLVRHLFDVIDVIFLVGLIVASTNKNKQRIGDLVAKTVVIKKA